MHVGCTAAGLPRSKRIRPQRSRPGRQVRTSTCYRPLACATPPNFRFIDPLQNRHLTSSRQGSASHDYSERPPRPRARPLLLAERTMTEVRELTPAVTPSLEMANVLFLDIVAYSQLHMDQQQQAIQELQDAVRSTSEFARAQAEDQLIRLPTGDGMALVFFGDPEAPVRCALELTKILRAKPDIQLRMGIHAGPVYRIADINANRNVAGGGINIAQRVMDCGDAGSILLSKTMAEVLAELSSWTAHLRDLGEAEVKHGVRVHLYNLHTGEAGNAEIPQKLGTAVAAAAQARAGSAKKKLSLGLVAACVVATVVV